MDRDLLIAAGEAAFGPRWQRDIAEALGVNDRTVRNWVSGRTTGIPSIDAELAAILRERASAMIDIAERIESGERDNANSKP